MVGHELLVVRLLLKDLGFGGVNLRREDEAAPGLKAIVSKLIESTSAEMRIDILSSVQNYDREFMAVIVRHEEGRGLQQDAGRC